ncbi:MAG: hypothetical protein J6Z03_06910 [Erysipelotrichaceae bacterium]|nr:hypothetical protein [Erysipelotrichaceae bacterium]
MKSEKNFSLLNCIATALLACFITVPGHELLHLLTHMIYGSKLLWYSAGAVDAIVEDYSVLSPFHRIMVAGGSASILNAVFGIILVFILFRVKMGPLTRVFLTQLMGAQMVQGVGYFLIGGLFGAGDWGNVYAQLPEYPGLVMFLRIFLSILGSAGIVALFFILNHMSYYFIEDKDDKKERFYVSFRLHLVVLICGFTIGMICTAVSPALKSGELTILLGALYNMMWIPFFWAFMYTAYLVKPPKEGRFLYHLPVEPHYGLVAVSILLVLFEIVVLGPGIRLS